MTVELKVPDVGESIQEVQIGAWHKHEGDAFAEDESLVELETDKAAVDVPAPRAGVLVKILKQQGETVAVGEAIAELGDAPEKGTDGNGRPGKRESPSKAKAKPKASEARQAAGDEEHREEKKDDAATEAQAERPATERRAAESTAKSPDGDDVEKDAARSIEPPPDRSPESAGERIVPLSPIRRRIGERLVKAQQTAALLTTFNEIDMSGVQRLRRAHGEAFQKEHGVKLGLMSFFVKAAVRALKQYPELNAEIRDNREIVYRDYSHVGIAVASERGLVVPVLRHAERMSFAEMEQAIADFAKRAGDASLKPDELSGGTFTITNGGVFGSLFSTPIVNPPQSGVLGMHAISERPMARNGHVVILPMMYVALTYDHRIVDGREAVSFLRSIKESLEEPARMLLEM